MAAEAPGTPPGSGVGVAVAILAGGASARMGRPKATIVLGGLTLVQRLGAAVLSAGLDEPTVIGGERSWADAMRWIPDAVPGQGPLGGLLRAFETITPDAVLLLACDLVTPEPHALAALAARFADGQRRTPPVDAVIPVDTRREVLHAVYHRRLDAGLRAAFDHGERSIDRALRHAAGSALVDDVPVDEIAGLRASIRDADEPDQLPDVVPDFLPGRG